MSDGSEYSVSKRGPQRAVKALLLEKIKKKDDYVSLELNTERCCGKSHTVPCLWAKHKNKIAVKTCSFNCSSNGFIRMMMAHKQMQEMYYGRTARVLVPLQHGEQVTEHQGGKQKFALVLIK